MIAERVGIAKGTIYKHFQSKDELILQLLIAYETGLAEEIHRAIATGSVPVAVQAYFTYRLFSPEKHLLPYFARLYFIRKSHLRDVMPLVADFLKANGSAMTPRDYLSAVWAMVQGSAAILHSTFYQRYLGDRDGLLAAMLQTVQGLGRS